MSDLGTYSFLPWLRQGLANRIQSADFDNSVKVRAQIQVELDLKGDKVAGGGQEAVHVNRSVALFGAGDIVGVDKRAIVRVEPRDWITNFEPNYLALMEFYDEDFPWRYTPAAPDLSKGRLRPWVTLIVLSEDPEEFTDGKNVMDRPLPFIEVNDLNLFPRADELWAWAHVHVNEGLAANDAEFVSKDMGSVLPKLQAVLNKNPDLAYSRVVCPRRLAPNTPYHAFLIPTFETGRRAGLNLEIGDIPATMSAWDPGVRPEGQSFPYYHRWFFRTGTTGDFESLVRLLVPKRVDRRVGTREMDVQNPDPLVSGVDNPELGGVLKLGGALRPPAKVPPELPDKYETWDDPFPRPLQEDLAKLINLPDDYLLAGHPDPIVAPPIYGTWHALSKRVLFEADGSGILPNDNWLHRLNLDPRFRVPAGFGTRIIQDQQEKLMDAAWEQIGKVLEAQRKIRFGQFGLQVSQIWYDRHLMPLLGVSQQKTLLLMAPLNKRILVDGSSVHQELRGGLVQPPMTSAALRRIVRPRGRLIQNLQFDPARPLEELISRVNAGEVTAAPPKVTPEGVFTTDDAAEAVMPKGLPSFVVKLLRRFPRLPLILLILAVLLALLLLLFALSALSLLLGLALVAVGWFAFRRLTRASQAIQASDSLQESNQTPSWVDHLPSASGFAISEPGAGVKPGTGADSVEAGRFKQALRDAFEVVQASAAATTPRPSKRIDFDRVTEVATRSIDPAKTIPRRVLGGIFIPPRIKTEMAETFVEPMAYPVIDLPMYQPLKDRSSELFCPNINLVEFNSITLLQTNQRFIESYMVGLNHEFARELLWREYPTDQRGSTFRQFWDVKSYLNSGNLSDEDLKEKLRDIPPIHTWPKASALGSHDHREEEKGRDEDELVLVIRGELLKRYPTAVIYAHRACWQRKDGSAADLAKDPCLRSGGIDNTKERRLAPLTAAEEAKPPPDKVKTPLYEAKIDPDIYFFGFDLTPEVAKGDSGEDPNDDPGWFIVIKERPGEPRFGLDEEKQEDINVWNDLSWQHVKPTATSPHIEIASTPSGFPLANPVGEEDEKKVQHEDDKKVAWSHSMSSAELAYILFQAPVLVGVHASEMLPK